MKIYQIAAVSENNVIGKDNGIPWRIKGDLPRFKDLTYGHPVIMGRKTLESMGKYGPLEGRLNVVLTSKEAIFVDGRPIVSREEGIVTVARDNGKTCHLVLAGSVDEALSICEEQKAHEVYVIGGERVYQETFDLADTLRLTHVHREVEGGDAFYPEVDPEVWVPSYVEIHPSGAHTYIDYVRRSVTGL